MTSSDARHLRASLACGAIVAVLLLGARPAADQPRATLRRAPETKMPATADSNSPAHWSGDTLYVFNSWNHPSRSAGRDQFSLGAPQSIPDKAARIVTAPGGERIAVFRDGARIGAVTNLCAHQNGPLGEGRIVNGCITCPWHGYEYRLADGCAPPPFTEKLATYRLRLDGDVVLLDLRPNPPGTPVAPVPVP